MPIFRRITTIYVSLLTNKYVLYHILSGKSKEIEKKLRDLTQSSELKLKVNKVKNDVRMWLIRSTSLRTSFCWFLVPDPLQKVKLAYIEGKLQSKEALIEDKFFSLFFSVFCRKMFDFSVPDNRFWIMTISLIVNDR